MRLVMIDDEKGIVDGLKTIVRRYLPQCEVVGTAHNGIDGCKLVQELQPDIVITDIRMPQSDGLEMIRKLTSSGCKAKFIILSGYAEFEYARKGIELGVKFYITKPVEEEELEECVTKVIAEINMENVQARHGNDLILKDILMSGYNPAAHDSHILNLLHVPVSGHHCVCALLEFGSEPGKLHEERILGRLSDDLSHYDQVQAFRYEGSQFAVIIVNEKSIDESNLLRDLKTLQEAFNQFGGISVTVGIGRPYPAPDGLSTSFEEAQQALRYKLIKGTNAVIPYIETEQISDRGKVVSEEDMAMLEKCIEDMDAEGSSAIIQRIFRTIEAENRMNLAELQHQILLILLSSMRRMSFMQLQMNDFLGKYMLSQDEISRFKTLDELKLWLIQATERIIEHKLIRSTPKKKDVISDIKEYVAVHYNSNITLADLSARFFINPYYLSQLFKEKTGDTYLSYVMGIRIKKAKELLEETDLKIYEICQMVGYADTNHFSKLFERMNGCTPTEYRKKCKI
jgi:two-component system response regulator YesN